MAEFYDELGAGLFLWVPIVPFIFLALIGLDLLVFFHFRSSLVYLASCPGISWIWFHCVSLDFSLMLVRSTSSSSSRFIDLSDQNSIMYLVMVRTVACSLSCHLIMRLDGSSGILGVFLILGMRSLGGLLVIMAVCSSSV